MNGRFGDERATYNRLGSVANKAVTQRMVRDLGLFIQQTLQGLSRGPLCVPILVGVKKAYAHLRFSLKKIFLSRYVRPFVPPNSKNRSFHLSILSSHIYILLFETVQ